MDTIRKMIAAAPALTLAVVSFTATTALAGPLANLTGGVHRAGGASRVALSLAALRPNLSAPMAQRPQLSLDAPRANSLKLGALRAQLPTAAEAVAASTHDPKGLHWEDASAPVDPRLVTLARNYHREGLPLVKLWQADRNMVSIGLNPHGVPGIFFTQSMGK